MNSNRKSSSGVPDNDVVLQKRLDSLSKSATKSKKRVVDFDLESSLSLGSILPTHALSPMPDNFFERAEPLSPTELARAMGMDAHTDTPLEEETANGLFSFSTTPQAASACIPGTIHELESESLANESSQKQSLTQDSPFQASFDQQLACLSSSQTDSILDTTKRDQLQQESSLGINHTDATSEIDPSIYATNDEAIGVDNMSKSNSLDITVNCETVASLPLDADKEPCLDSHSSGELSRTTEEIIRDAISQAGCEVAIEESAGNANNRYFFSGSALSLREEELELLKTPDLGFTSEDMAHGLHTYLDNDSSLSDLSTLSEPIQELVPTLPEDLQVQFYPIAGYPISSFDSGSKSTVSMNP